MTNLSEIVEKAVIEGLKRAATVMPEDIYAELKKRYSEETNSVAKSQLEAIIKNIELAMKLSKPICQDTGLISFFVNVGDDFPLRSELRRILYKATEKATKEVPLRPNAVDLLKGNTRNNIGLRGYVPWIYWNLVEGDKLEIYVVPKGGGSSNVSKLFMLPPGLGWKGIKRAVVDAVVDAGSKGCPPYVVGVGIGGGEDMAMTLGKMALLRKIGTRHPEKEIADIEIELLNAINRLEIGVMGLGGGPTAIDVHIEIAARHPASLPVGIVMSCWALRHKKVTIYKDGAYEISD
ncbi:MAG: fumarate hydratase [Candidatus Asgardarchaeia archaeon]